MLEYLSARAFRGATSLIGVFIASAFLDAQFGDVQHVKYPVMLLSGGGAAAWLMFAMAFNQTEDATRRLAKALLWGVAVGIMFVVIMHVPATRRATLRTLNAAHAKNLADYAVGMAALFATLGLGLIFWRLSDD